MRSILQNSFTKKTAGSLLGAALCLFGTDTSAATFTLKTGTNLNWNGGTNTWDVTNGTPLNNSFPSYNDDVIINGGNSVILNIGTAECHSLTITAELGSGNGSTSLLNVGANNLRVYGTIVVSGGNSNKLAQLSVTSGIVELTNALSPNFPAGTPNGEKDIIEITAGGLIQPNKTSIGPLPVELVSFTAAKKAGEVALTWETASEKNNTGFEVQVSADGKNYEALSFVASRNGNSSAAQRYAYAHKTANKEGLVYYRLKQVDMNGDFEYYTAKVVDLGRIAATVNTFPNPFQNSFELNLSSPATATADILVVDMTGKTVYAAKQELTKGANTIKVELNNQPAGIYLLKAAAGNQTYSNRLVKQ